MSIFHSNGKLLITAEYLVLDGADALALPTKLGQSLTVEQINAPIIKWQSLNENGQCWYTEEFKIDLGVPKQIEKDDISNRLSQIFEAIKTLNPKFFSRANGYNITTSLDFPRDWGLGTSSTLINNLAQWAKVDPYDLLKLTFGGSGYDIACAQNSKPITYQLKQERPLVKTVDFQPAFHSNLYFVHLNRKQNSREGIAYYKMHRHQHEMAILEINAITQSIINCETLSEFESLINRHEVILAEVTNQIPVKHLLFNDFPGSMKSLGAWGGDFILVASEDNPFNYFRNKGYRTIIPYQDLIK